MSKPRLVCCLVGKLLGDAWVTLPGLIDLCKEHDVRLISGTYALPVWEWAQRHIKEATFVIDRVIPDPDDAVSPYTPGYGYIAMDAAQRFVESEMPGETIIGAHDIPVFYDAHPNFTLQDIEVIDGDFFVVHPHSRHDWKIEDYITMKVQYPLPVKCVGLPGEYYAPSTWENLSGAPFETMVEATLRARCVVAIHSSFMNLAGLFGKRQIVVSHHTDMPLTNPRALKLFHPTIDQLQEAINAVP